MPIGAIIGGGAAIGSALIGSSATSDAANAQAQSSAAALALNRQEFNRTQANEAPWLSTGGGALAKLGALYGIEPARTGSNDPAQSAYKLNSSGGPGGGFTNAQGGKSTVNPDASFYMSPDYNFALTQGLKGITASGAAGNGTDNGATKKAEIGYAGNLASTQYADYKNSLLSLAGLGQTANGTSAAAGTALAGQGSSILQNQGNNLASSYLGQGQIAANGLTSLGGVASRYFGDGSSSLPTVSNFNGPAPLTAQPISQGNLQPAPGF